MPAARPKEPTAQEALSAKQTPSQTPAPEEQKTETAETPAAATIKPSRFQPAEKTQQKARIALVSPSGGGKTFTALRIASGLAPHGRIALIDTEHGSSQLYADRFKYDVVELATFSPETYAEYIREAGAAGYDVIVIDSLSHAWMGKEGALEQVDHRKAQPGGQFSAWREVTPMHNDLIEAMLSSPAHIIATMRSKTEYVVESDDRGRMTPRKIGLAPIQRDGLEYEFTIVGEMTLDHVLHISKSRVSEFQDKHIQKPSEEFGAAVASWLALGAPAKPRPAPLSAPPPAPAAKNGTPPADSNTKRIDPMTLDLIIASGKEWPEAKRAEFYDNVLPEWGFNGADAAARYKLFVNTAGGTKYVAEALKFFENPPAKPETASDTSDAPA